MKKSLTALILVLVMILTFTACKAEPIPEEPEQDVPDASGTENTDSSIYPENTEYYLLPDGSLYAFMDNPKVSEEGGDVYSGMLWLGYTLVRDNTAEANSVRRFGQSDEFNGLTVEDAESSWERWGGMVYPDISPTEAVNQELRFTGEITFTGKAKLYYAPAGNVLNYGSFVLDEECASKMPVFVSRTDEDEFGYREEVYFILTGESMKYDEIEKLLLDGKEVSITVTTDDFGWYRTGYGYELDGSTFGRFNNIIDFKYTVK